MLIFQLNPQLDVDRPTSPIEVGTVNRIKRYTDKGLIGQAKAKIITTCNDVSDPVVVILIGMPNHILHILNFTIKKSYSLGKPSFYFKKFKELQIQNFRKFFLEIRYNDILFAEESEFKVF